MEMHSRKQSIVKRKQAATLASALASKGSRNDLNFINLEWNSKIFYRDQMNCYSRILVTMLFVYFITSW